MVDWQGMSHGSWHLHGHIHSCGDAYNKFNLRQGLLRYDVGADANSYAPVSLEELKLWFVQVDEPVSCVNWPWWVNATGNEQIEHDLETYKREVVIR